jgi:hypothetical protein
VLAVLWIGLFSISHSQSPSPLREPGQLETVMVVFERFGGFAGICERFEIHRDGVVMTPTGRTLRIPLTQVDSLRRKIAALQDAQPCETKCPQFLCFDCFEYRITVRNNSGKVVRNLNELQLGGQDRVSKLATSIRDIVSGLKWQ